MPSNVHEKIAQAIFHNRPQVEKWFQDQFCLFTKKGTPPPFYSSIDVRDSGFKAAPVDCNLFPAGFNNICDVDLENAPCLVMQELMAIARTTQTLGKKILLIPESHTKNKNYLENIYTLKSIFERSGVEFRLGWYEDLTEPYLELSSATEKLLQFHATQVETQANGLRFLRTKDGFQPDWIILNNDFSQSFPEKLKNLAQPIFPDPRLGWHHRTKSQHFKFYNKFATDFANLINVDPWLITVQSEAVPNVDFSEGTGLDQVYEVTKKMLSNISAEYSRRNISDRPAVFIKNDSGTYGIGIMVVHDAEELKNLNRRTKNKMSVGKGQSQIHQVIIQEGIPTRHTTDGQTSEPVIYMVGTELLGGFVRANSERDSMDNLNSSGMVFKKFCFKDLKDSWSENLINEFPVLEAVYGSIAKLAALAATQEHHYEKTNS